MSDLSDFRIPPGKEVEIRELVALITAHLAGRERPVISSVLADLTALSLLLYPPAYRRQAAELQGLVAQNLLSANETLTKQGKPGLDKPLTRPPGAQTEGFTALTLIAAGAVTEDDGLFGMIQNIPRDHAEAFADWLALATAGAVRLGWLSFPSSGVNEITREGPQSVKIARSGRTRHKPSK